MTRKRQVLTLCLSLGLAACSDGDSSKPESGDAAVDGDNSAPIECNGDNPCAAGVCMGASCSGSWSCGATTVACAADLTDYCGCDGLTFQDSGSCPRKPFAYKGKCEDGVSCDVRQVTCSTATPACAYEEDVPRVVGSCYDQASWSRAPSARSSPRTSSRRPWRTGTASSATCPLRDCRSSGSRPSSPG